MREIADGRYTYDGRERFRLFPRRRSGLSFLYVCVFVNDVTKIGCAMEPRLRVGEHWRTSHKFGGMLWAHVTAPVRLDDVRAIERVALMKAANSSRRIGDTEYFSGLSREMAIACVRDAMREFYAREADSHDPEACRCGAAAAGAV